MVSLGETPSQAEGTPHWQTDLDCSAEGIRTLSLKVSGITEASKQTSELGEIVRTSAKVLIGNDSSMKESQKQLMGTLDSADGRQTELMKTLLEGGHNCKNLVRVMVDLFQRMDGIFDLRGRNGAGSNVKFDAKFIQPEIGRIELCVQKLTGTYDRLSILSDPVKQHALEEVIQEACDKIISSDILKEVRCSWSRLQELEEEEKKVLVARNKKESEVQLKQAEKEFLEEQERQAGEEERSVKERMETKKAELQQFKEKIHRSKADFIASCQAQQKDLEKNLEILKLKQEEHQRKSRAPLDACEAMLQKKQDELLQLDEHNINHILMVLDNSGSMYYNKSAGVLGKSRLEYALEAVDAFLKPLVMRGSQDRVSAIAFNSDAKCVARSVPVTHNIVDALRKEGITGTTSFQSAWRVIKECADSDPKYARLVVVFLSDGLCPDIGAAAKKAQEIHEACEMQKRSMCAFFVHIAEAESKDHLQLQPLVKAANGGQDFLEVTGEKVPLLQLVKAQNLAHAFEKLNNLVSMQKCVLEARITSLRLQEKQSRERYAAKVSDYSQQCKDKAKELEEAKRLAGKASRQDREELELLFQQLEEELDAEVRQLKKDLEDAGRKTLKLKQESKKCSVDLEQLQRDFKQTQEAAAQHLDHLQRLKQDHVTSMDQMRSKQRSLHERFGTTNEKLLMQQLESLQKMKYQLKRNCMLETDLKCMVDNIVLFSTSLKEQIAQPLPGGTEKISKAKVALKILLQQRRLPYKGVPQEDMWALLKYEAFLQGSDPEEVFQTIVKAEVRAEDLCMAVNEHDPEKVAEIKETLVKDFEKKFFQFNDCDSEAVEDDIGKKKRDLKKKKAIVLELLWVLLFFKQQEQLSKIQEDLKKAFANGSASEEDVDWEVIQEDLQSTIDKLQDEKKSLEDELKDLEKDLKAIKKEQQVVCKALKPCAGLLKLAVDTCREAFLEHIAEEEKAALLSIMASFKTNVAEAVGALCTMSEQARQAYAPERPVLAESTCPFALQDARSVD